MPSWARASCSGGRGSGVVEELAIDRVGDSALAGSASLPSAACRARGRRAPSLVFGLDLDRLFDRDQVSELVRGDMPAVLPTSLSVPLCRRVALQVSGSQALLGIALGRVGTTAPHPPSCPATASVAAPELAPRGVPMNGKAAPRPSARKAHRAPSTLCMGTTDILSRGWPL